MPYSHLIFESTETGMFRTSEEWWNDTITLLPYKREVSRSDNVNSRIGENYTYPSDYPDHPVYAKMKSLNILEPVISKEMYSDITPFLQRQTTNYKEWSDKIFAPETIQFQTKNQSTPETRVTYHNRDSHGNPLYISKDNADKVVYLWGYKHQYPIAKIENATYAEVVDKIGNAVEHLSDNTTTYSYSNTVECSKNYQQPPVSLSFTLTHPTEISLDMNLQEAILKSEESDVYFSVVIKKANGQGVANGSFDSRGLQRVKIRDYGDVAYYELETIKKVQLPPGDYIVELDHTLGYNYAGNSTSVDLNFWGSCNVFFSSKQAYSPTEEDFAALNNLRQQLPNAQITTYTYKPLVGIETITDPRGVKITYHYDSFGRLQWIEDENGKKIENYDYHYKN